MPGKPAYIGINVNIVFFLQGPSKFQYVYGVKAGPLPGRNRTTLYVPEAELSPHHPQFAGLK